MIALSATTKMSTQTSEQSGVKRRDFLKVLGITGAATATVGCGSERVEKLIPYLVSPDQTVPGVSTYYATTCRECAVGCGVIAENRDGRTIKLEGNPAHPLNRGALCARGQSALQGLYNPDRYRGPMVRRDGKLVQTTWNEALQIFTQKLSENRGRAGNAVFINQHETGSFPAVLDQWLSTQGIPSHISYDAEAATSVIAANKQSYGVAWPGLDFNAAKLIISFGADFLDNWGASVPQQLDYANARAKLQDAPRMVYVGPRRSLTGLNADQWIDCKAGSEIHVLHVLTGAMTAAQAASLTGVKADKLTRLAAEFRAVKPSMLLAGGGNAGNGSGAYDLAVAVNAANQSAGNVGVTIKSDSAIQSFEGIASASDVYSLVGKMNAGDVSMLMVRGANPAYTLGKNSGFAAAMSKVPFKVSFSSLPDETTELCDLILPDHHSLEQWGDAEPVRGTLSLQQPTMEPVFDTRSTADVLLSLSNGTDKDYRSWLTSRFPGGAAALTAALPKGIASGSLVSRTILPRAVGQGASLTTPAARTQSANVANANMDLLVYQHPVLGDGRGANKPWLQELPDPVTKVCWQTVAEIHPNTAKKMGIGNGDHVTIEAAGGKLTLPTYLYLGIRPDTVAIATGRGHSASGRYAKAGESPLDLFANGVMPGTTRVRVTNAGTGVRLVTTEGSARQHGRGIAQALTVNELIHGEHGHRGHEFNGDASHEFLPGLRSPVANDAQGELGDPTSKDHGMYDPNHWSGMAKRRWAMTIDLARCTGCSACVTACYAENNIPTVGHETQGPQVLPDRTGFGANITRSREMSWLRLERYFEGGENGEPDFEARFVPMMCQHCGNAPCEPVCPVYATYHAPDGLNVQVYNRCVGTRYCSNNCPYKVRYFNWFGYGEPDRAQYAFPEPLNWQLNPDVTVRAKGVMEKCTFCVQRIREAENHAKSDNRELRPDEFTTACAEACPSRAIVFGDAADENWTVAKLAKDKRAYHVFEELNTYTAVVYLKKVNHE